MFNINYLWIDIECPQCQYMDQIQLIDAKIERLHFCNNCKLQIQLNDSEGSVHAGIESVNKAFKDLDDVFKKWEK